MESRMLFQQPIMTKNFISYYQIFLLWSVPILQSTHLISFYFWPPQAHFLGWAMFFLSLHDSYLLPEPSKNSFEEAFSLQHFYSHLIPCTLSFLDQHHIPVQLFQQNRHTKSNCKHCWNDTSIRKADRTNLQDLSPRSLRKASERKIRYFLATQDQYPLMRWITMTKGSTNHTQKIMQSKMREHAKRMWAKRMRAKLLNEFKLVPLERFSEVDHCWNL